MIVATHCNLTFIDIFKGVDLRNSCYNFIKIKIPPTKESFQVVGLEGAASPGKS